MRNKLARFYASRTLLHEPITPEFCAEAILWLAGDRSGRTTGHIVPVDGGLPEAFLRDMGDSNPDRWQPGFAGNRV